MTLADQKTYGQGRYEVIELLGRGPFSTVHRAYDTESDSQVALKVLGLSDHDRDIAQAMFTKEVDALNAFESESVVKLLDYFVDSRSGAFCIVLELVRNAVSLDKVVSEVGQGVRERLGLEWLLVQLRQLMVVLDQAHKRGIIHRDVKPANLIMGGSKGKEVIKLADFGIARIFEHFGRDKGLTLPHFATFPYAPPEQVLQRETSALTDYYSYGVTAVSLLTNTLPREALEGDSLERFLAPISEVFEQDEGRRLAEGLFRGLLQEVPKERPRPQEVLRVLDRLLSGVASRPRVGLTISGSAKERLKNAGISLQEFFADLNNWPMAEYQENVRNGTRVVNVRFFGRSVWALTAVDRDDPERLVVVDAGVGQPALHMKDRQKPSVRTCSYELVEGRANAYDLLNEFYEHFRAHEASRHRAGTKEELLKTGSYILSQLEDEATELVIRYRLPSDQLYEDILTVEVLDVMGIVAGSSESIEYLDDEVIERWINGLDTNTSIGLRTPGRRNRETLGSIRGYNGYTRELSIGLSAGHQPRLPEEGELVCQNVAQLASISRQRHAIAKFMADDTVNPNLGDLLLDPRRNRIGRRSARTLFQKLEPEDEMLDLVERALAAEDFFLIQGPPGTGKTTLIAELVMQILEASPTARILVTAQANPAVDNAMERIRGLAADKGREIKTLRITAAQKREGRSEFEDTFALWVDRTRASSAAGLADIIPSLTDEAKAKVSSVVSNWRERVGWAPEVKGDYAKSVQVYGVTCLIAPRLWEIMPEIEFDWVIVDEAAKATDTEVLVPLVYGKRAILVGDQKQLPPYVGTEIERKMRLDGLDGEAAATSLFEKLFEQVPPSNKVTLTTQFRMHRSIGDFVGGLFYSDIGGLKTGVPDAKRAIALPDFDQRDHRVIWVDVPGGNEEREQGGTSLLNRSEAIRVNAVLEDINRKLATRGVTYNVGVITPYKAQVELLRAHIVPTATTWTNLKVEVSTVDSFQGRENDITVYSMVKTQPGTLKFIEYERRLNVSFSRARLALFIFGHRSTALTSETFRKAIRMIPSVNVLGGGESHGSNQV